MRYTFNFSLICTVHYLMSYPTDKMHSLGSAWQAIAGAGLMTYTMGWFMVIVEL